MLFVFDSAPLIYFGKTRVLEKIAKLNAKFVIPKTVYKEVVETGLEAGFEDAAYVKELVNSGLFVVKEVPISDKRKILAGIDEADMETLLLAKELKGAAITDDQKVRNLASLENTESAGSVYIILLLVKNKIITKIEAKSLIDKIIEFGWYCSTDLYTVIVESLATL
ncbi:MAG TPA: DUF3368 domain-containing protein [archaeon]|nr:DUF3368 domain-containing protein [archaeon]